MAEFGIKKIQLDDDLITEIESLGSSADIATGDANTLASSNTYTDGAITQIKGGVGVTYDTLKKLADELIAIRAIVGSTSTDADNIIDTITELMAVLTNYPEGTDLFLLVQGKVDKIDVYNALDCVVSGKVADARQLKVLNDFVVAMGTSVKGDKITPSTTPSGTGVASWLVAESGTYTNFGGVILPVNHIGFIIRSASNVYSITSMELDLTGYAKNELIKTVLTLPNQLSVQQLPDKNTGVNYNWGSGRILAPFLVDVNRYYNIFNLGYSSAGHAGVLFKDVNGTIITTSIFQVNGNYVTETGLIKPPVNAVTMQIAYDAGRITGIPSIATYCIYLLNEKVSVLEQEFEAKGEKKWSKYTLFVAWKIQQKILSYPSGLEVAWGSGRISDYISVKTGQTYSVSNLGYSAISQACVVFYDLNKSVLSSGMIQLPGSYLNDTELFEVPSNAYFMRISHDLNRTTGSPVLYTYDVQIIKDIVDSIPKSVSIDVIGDSIASSIGSMLSSVSPIDSYTVRNRAVGGETTLDTLARLNVYPFLVQPFTIPATTTNVIVNLSSSFGRSQTINNTTGQVTQDYGSPSINPYGSVNCSINGIKGTLIFKRGGDNINHYFRRDVAGSSIVLNKVNEVFIDVDRKMIPVVFMGTNGGWDVDFAWPANGINATFEDADNLVNYYKKIEEHIKTVTNDYLFLGYYLTAFSDQKIQTDYNLWWNYYLGKMQETFGNKFLNIKQYLRTYGWKDCGYTLTQTDIDAINFGKVPNVVLGDGTHLTGKASACVANEVIKRLYINGVISSYTLIDVNSII
jgi:hypothetical protein